MKNILTVVLMFAVMLLAGCGSEKPVETPEFQKPDKNGVDRIIYASEQNSCTCVLEFEDIDAVIEMLEEKNSLLYHALLGKGKFLLIKNDTKVASYYAKEYRGFVPVIFMEGEYKGRRAYVLSSRLQE